MSSVKVAVRVRPFNTRENVRKCKNIIVMNGAMTSEFSIYGLFISLSVVLVRS